jgi:hypothetical protein
MNRKLFTSALSTLLVSVLLFSCRPDEQKIANKMEGTWQVREMTYQSGFENQYELPQTGTFSFDQCTVNKSSPATCYGSISLEGVTNTMVYNPPQVKTSNSPLTTNIHMSNDNATQLILVGTYEVDMSVKSSMILKGGISIRNESAVTKYEYSRIVIKLSK